MSNLQILTQSIRIFENLYALNDLHIASGGKSKHQPSNFVRLDTTKALIAEIEKDNQHALKIIRGTNGGTYACEELVIAYAMWISPQFHLVVLRAFLAMHRNQPQQLALPEPEKKFTFEFTEYELQRNSTAPSALPKMTTEAIPLPHYNMSHKNRLLLMVVLVLCRPLLRLMAQELISPLTQILALVMAGLN